MKKKFVYIVIVLSLVFMAMKPDTSGLKSIKIVKVSMAIMMSHAITCDKFDAFSKSAHGQTFIITSQKDMKTIVDGIASSKKWEPEGGSCVDTRAKIFLYYKSGRVDSICMAATSVFLLNGNDCRYFSNNDVLYFIDSL